MQFHYFSLAWPSWYMSHYTMLCKYGKRTRNFGGIFTFIFVFYIFWWRFINKCTPRWLSIVSYATHARGIIVLQCPVEPKILMVKAAFYCKENYDVDIPDIKRFKLSFSSMLGDQRYNSIEAWSAQHYY